MKEAFRRIQALESNVEYLMQKAEYFENKNTSFEEELNHVKETTTSILNLLNSKHQTRMDKVIKSITMCQQTQQQHQEAVTFILELSDGKIAVSCGRGSISLNHEL